MAEKNKRTNPSTTTASNTSNDSKPSQEEIEAFLKDAQQQIDALTEANKKLADGETTVVQVLMETKATLESRIESLEADLDKTAHLVGPLPACAIALLWCEQMRRVGVPLSQRWPHRYIAEDGTVWEALSDDSGVTVEARREHYRYEAFGNRIIKLEAELATPIAKLKFKQDNIAAILRTPEDKRNKQALESLEPMQIEVPVLEADIAERKLEIARLREQVAEARTDRWHFPHGEPVSVFVQSLAPTLQALALGDPGDEYTEPALEVPLI